MSKNSSYYTGIARNFPELCEGFRLVQRRYQELGYADAASSGMRYSFYNLLPHTQTLVTVLDEKIVGTVTIIRDSFGARLPLSGIFPVEYGMGQRRRSVRAEASMFACDESLENTGMGAYLGMMHLAVQYCIRASVDELYVVANPKHVGFYQRVLGFRLAASAQSCGHVKQHPGVLLHIAIDEIINTHYRESSPLGRVIMNHPIAPDALAKRSLSSSEAQVLIGLERVRFMGLPRRILRELFEYVGEDNFIKALEFDDEQVLRIVTHVYSGRGSNGALHAHLDSSQHSDSVE